jgi:hypothetical protein
VEPVLFSGFVRKWGNFEKALREIRGGDFEEGGSLKGGERRGSFK